MTDYLPLIASRTPIFAIATAVVLPAIVICGALVRADRPLRRAIRPPTRRMMRKA